MADRSGRFRLNGDDQMAEWELIHPDGFVIAASTSASSPEDAQRAIEWIKANAADCPVVDE